MKKVLRKYRVMSDCIHEDVSLEQFEKEEDEHRAFALFEMRSRIMEKDIERGLERRGGTVPVDDLVTTPYHRTAYRVRDAVIVSKAWRDGASPKDVVNSAILTRRAERTYYIRRPGRPNTSMSSDNMSYVSGISISSQRSYWWEPVSWLDDTDFELYRCPSLGPRNMRGSEMFTIGDCQSMLLKLTNEQCIVRPRPAISGLQLFTLVHVSPDLFLSVYRRTCAGSSTPPRRSRSRPSTSSLTTGT
jgi:hypothetical protein